MKHKILTTLSLISIVSFASGQANPDQVQSRIEGTNRAQNTPVAGQLGADQSSSNNTAAESDTGAQRPVSLSESEISAYFGYDTKYFYRSNPLAQSGDLDQVSTDMWTNTFFSGLSTVIDDGAGVYTPFLSGSYTINDYLQDDLGDFNYNSSHLSTGLFSYYGGASTYFAKVDYNMDKSTENDTEDYSEFFPQIGLITSYNLSDSFSVATTIGIGYHLTTISDAGGSRVDDLLDNLDIYAMLSPSFSDIPLVETLGITYRVSFQTYENGTYSDREDITHSFIGGYAFTLFDADSPKLNLFSVYSSRNSNQNTFDYKSVDAGIGLTLIAEF